MFSDLHRWAAALKGRISSGSIRCPGPGHSPKDDSLLVTPASHLPDGFLVHSFAGDDWRICREHVRLALNIEKKRPRSGGTSAPFNAALRTVVSVNKNKYQADRIWKYAEKLEGSPAQDYLLRRLKGHKLPQAVLEGDVLRWSSDCRVAGAIGAMIALLTDPVTGKPTGIQQTFVSSDLRNIPGRNGRSLRLTLGKEGIARLWGDAEVSLSLALGEGVETTLAGAIATGQTPAWATIGADNMMKFPVLPGVEGLALFVDNDLSHTGQRAANACAERWYTTRGVRVRFFTPSIPDSDFNDILGEWA